MAPKSGTKRARSDDSSDKTKAQIKEEGQAPSKKRDNAKKTPVKAEVAKEDKAPSTDKPKGVSVNPPKEKGGKQQPSEPELPDFTASIEKAITALKKIRAQQDDKNWLFTDEKFYELTVTIKHEVKLRQKPKMHALPLQHRLWAEDTEVCLFVPEPRKKEWGRLAAPVPNVKKILTLRNLGKRFNTPKLRKQLMNSFRIFLAEKVCFHLLVLQ